ncbi:1571_t:CDS:2, partial [Gigaspora rosea]
QRINTNRTDLVSKSLIKCWVLVAKSAQLVFKKSYSTDDYENLQKWLETEIHSQIEHIFNIKLKKRIHLQDLEEKVPCQINNFEFRSELYLSYCDFGYIEALINTGLSFYEGITYLVENSYNIIEKYSLHV